MSTTKSRTKSPASKKPRASRDGRVPVLAAPVSPQKEKRHASAQGKPGVRDQVAAAHEAARTARRAGKPADVIEGLNEKARELERRESKA